MPPWGYPCSNCQDCYPYSWWRLEASFDMERASLASSQDRKLEATKHHCRMLAFWINVSSCNLQPLQIVYLWLFMYVECICICIICKLHQTPILYTTTPPSQYNTYRLTNLFLIWAASLTRPCLNGLVVNLCVWELCHGSSGTQHKGILITCEKNESWIKVYCI